MIGVKKNLISKLALYSLSFLVLFVAECIMNGVIYNTFFVEYPLIEISGLLAILSPILIFKRERNASIYSSIIVVFSLTLVLLNLILDYASGDIFSLKYVFLAGEAAKVFSIQFLHWGYIFMYLALIAIYFIGVKAISLTILKNHVYNYRYHHLGYTLFFMLTIITSLMKIPSYNDIVDDSVNKVVYKDMGARKIINHTTNYLKKSSLKRYGLVSYTFSEIDNFIDYDFTSKMSRLDKFFNEAPDIKETEFSGLCEDMNVVTIMVETGVSFSINEYLTPNLYRLYNDGVAFTNNHSKNKTNISELIGILGSTGENAKSSGYTAPYSVPNMLNTKGYRTSFFHDNDSSFYSRDKIIPSLGFANSYFLEDINPEDDFLFFDGNYPLDSKFVEKALDKMIPDCEEPFYTFWTTFSTHGPYNEGQKNIAYFKEMGYYDMIVEAENKGIWNNPCLDDGEEIIAQIRNYEAEMMDLDRGIGLLIEKLEKIGEMDNTLFIIYGDHEMYYRSNGCGPLKSYMYNTTDISYSPQYETMMCFSNKKLQNKFKEVYKKTTIDEFTSPYVIVPTLLDLMGFKYNTNMYFGKSYFQINSEFENLFYSHELRVIFTDKVYAYELPQLEFVSTGCSDDYKEKFILSAYVHLERVEMFNDLYRLDYFKRRSLL